MTGKHPLHQAVRDYLTIRRGLGYRLDRPARLLPQFVDYLDDIGATTVTVQHAVAWARLPATASPRWWGERLSVIRSFAGWLATQDPQVEVPPADVLPCPRQRAVPYLYSQQDIAALVAATDTLRPALRAATFCTLIGLLAVTGMRVGEAIAADRADLDMDAGVLLVRSGKFGKSRELALHETTIRALGEYLQLRDQLAPSPVCPALLTTTAGKRLHYRQLSETFRGLTERAGLGPRSPSCRPRLHDLRHSFAVTTLLEGYRTGADVQTRVPQLSTYLGHSDPAHTYWYLQAAPELLSLAGDRLDQHVGGRR